MQNKTRMPAVFIIHGNPINAISDNPYRDAWRTLGATLPRPQAILCISAHWQSHGTEVCAVAKPHTIHDFSAFRLPYLLSNIPRAVRLSLQRSHTIYMRRL